MNEQQECRDFVTGVDEPNSRAASNPQGTATPEPPKWTITIEEQDHGYIVRVGCKTFAVESKTKLITKLSIYLGSRKEVEAAYYAGSFKLD